MPFKTEAGCCFVLLAQSAAWQCTFYMHGGKEQNIFEFLIEKFTIAGRLVLKF